MVKTTFNKPYFITYNANINCCLLHLLAYILIIYKIIMNYLHLNTGNAHSAVSSLFWLIKQKTTPLHTKHTTPLCNTLTIHSKHAKCHKSLNSQYLSLPVIHPPPSLPQLPVPQQPNLLLGHFCDKSLFLPFLPAPDTKQKWWQCSRKSVVDIIYPKSSFGLACASSPLPREVGRVGDLAASS